MGGRGTFASGRKVSYTYKTIGKIAGVKVLQKINPKDSAALPEEAHSSKAYILHYSNGTFKQYREFNTNHSAKFDIDYHSEPQISGHHESIYHIHFYNNGIRDKVGRELSPAEYKKYKKYFQRGVK